MTKNIVIQTWATRAWKWLDILRINYTSKACPLVMLFIIASRYCSSYPSPIAHYPSAVSLTFSIISKEYFQYWRPRACGSYKSEMYTCGDGCQEPFSLCNRWRCYASTYCGPALHGYHSKMLIILTLKIRQSSPPLKFLESSQAVTNFIFT